MVASSVLVGLGCVMVKNGDNVGWVFIILFGLGVLAPVLLLRSRAAWLELDEDGFTLCLSHKPDRYLWSHIREMAVWQGVVSFKLDSEHRGDRLGQTTARAISGYDGSIPNMFSLHPHELLELMRKYKQTNPQHAGTAPGS